MFYDLSNHSQKDWRILTLESDIRQVPNVTHNHEKYNVGHS